MMMNALSDGGLEPVHDTLRDKQVATSEAYGAPNYNPNPNGLYEASHKQYKDTYFPRDFPGQLVKSVAGGILRLCPLKSPLHYKVVSIFRDVEECERSYERAFNRPPPRVLRDPEVHAKYVNYFIDIAENRKDVKELLVVDYREVVADPLTCFTKLVEQGWPIDPEVAAKVVDPTLCRNRKEWLADIPDRWRVRN
jgi:hypothetical protein